MRRKTPRILLIVCGAALLIGVPALWRWTPLSEVVSIENAAAWFSEFRSSDVVALWVALFYVVGAVLFLPINLFIFLTALFFDDARAYVFVAGGVALNAATGYGMGRLGGPRAIKWIGSDRLDRVSREIANANFTDLFLFRLIPITPFSTINVICGALEMPVMRFAAATMASIAPGATLIVLFERTLMAFARNMSWQTGLGLSAALATLIGGALLLRRWAARRRTSRTTS